ncbi:GGDEF domain-containing protein [Pseudocolwellia agarivorans]|uniref:GGDEF domain-containing protein n=1 Tax=Pseudocolwellia agarivorans TaxID=1911682 RepID=UPI000985855A|nr:GGDEF domain-containing protein [Pseudocolwellia agarivorans]
MINQLQQKYQLSILFLLGIVAVVGVFPFVCIRFYEGNNLAAFIDLMLVIGIVSLVAYASYSKKIRSVSIVIALFINGGAVTIIVANGINSFLWIYPVLASTFIFIKPLEAFCINLLSSMSLIFFSDVFTIISLDSYIVATSMLSMSIFVSAKHSEKQFSSLEMLNSVDTLTGAFNRRAMNFDLESALSFSNRNGAKQLLVMLDLDYFKKINDKYGHAVGDQVLKEFVSIVQSNIRKSDRLYRFGGEEFVLLIPELNDNQDIFINNLREAIKAQLKTPDGKEITVSFGAAFWVPNTTEDTWLQRADEALYQAKSNGRNCVVFNHE